MSFFTKNTVLYEISITKSQAGVCKEMGGANFKKQRNFEKLFYVHFLKYNEIWHDCAFPSLMSIHYG